VISAAGGLVFKTTTKGRLKVLLAHRPNYDDWSLPKGKADQGETPEQTAVREVLEETGYHCRIVAPLGVTRYRMDRAGDVVKEVAWYAMRPLPDGPGFEPNAEIDRIKWVTPEKAREILDYEDQLRLLGESDLEALSLTGTLRLLRHALAGARDDWDDDDRVRPLSKKGKKQAEAIAAALAGAGIERIVSSPFRRCIQTVEPLARVTKANVEKSRALAEEADVDAAFSLLESLIGANAVLCSHGDVIPALVNRLVTAGLTLESPFYCAKGSIWEVEVDRGKFTSGRYFPPPEV
jgi:8-oxo-dGTP diphosphatase